MNSSKRLKRRVRNTYAGAKSKLNLVLPVIIVVVILLVINTLLTVRKINCSFNQEPCSKEVLLVLDKLQGANSLFINQKDLFAQITSVNPVDKINLGYKAFNTLNVTLTGNNPYITADVYLVNALPQLSMDLAPSSTDSAAWWVKPTIELNDFVSTLTPQNFNLWGNGLMTAQATSEASLSYIFTQKPTPETVSSIYNLTRIVLKYLDVSEIYILNQRCFLSQPGQPDIIVDVPFDEGNLISALQSINYLVTIKKDTRVIDLSFKNPIIRQ